MRLYCIYLDLNVPAQVKVLQSQVNAGDTMSNKTQQGDLIVWGIV